MHFIEVIEELQPLLRDFEKDDKLTLDNATQELGTKAGDNYLSVVIRSRATGKRGNGASV